MIQRGVVAYDEYRQHVYETYGERAAEEARYIFNPALAPPSWCESAAWAFDEIALGTGVYALEEAIIAMRSISRLRQAGATARLAATDLAHNRPVQLQQPVSTGGVAPNSLPQKPGQLQHIFRNAPGHLPDTPANRALLQQLANENAAILGVDQWGNTWAARLNADGTQSWVQYRNGVIINGGLNPTPRPFNPQTGLSGP